VDAWIGPYVAAGDFSGVVLLAQGETILAQKAWGSADIRTGTPNGLDTRFRVASLSKTFTAGLVERLAGDGRLSLKDPLERYVKGIPNGGAITLRDLLLHESGVADLDAPDMYRLCLPNAELLRRVRASSPLSPPGKTSHYSNTGYFLLAMAVEAASDRTYSDALGEAVLAPLKLANTGSACTSPPPGPNAQGHVPGAERGSLLPLPFEEAAMPGPGSLYSTAADLWTWMRAVDGDPRFSVGGLEYPFGWGKRNYSGRDLIEQTGIHEGFFAHIALYPREHLYGIVLSNVQSGLSSRVPQDLEAIFFGGKVSAPPAPAPHTVDLQALKAYTGVYATTAVSVPQTLEVVDGHLAMRWGEYPFWRALVPTGPDRFWCRHEYADVRFVRGPTGLVTRMTWQWPTGEPMAFDRR
jgi:CubicO group peptidase (beta-lactamase class C family)